MGKLELEKIYGFSSIQSENGGNFLALSWPSENINFLNGRWKIGKSGNYSSKQNMFAYENRGFEKDGVGDEVHFSSQLTENMEVYLLVRQLDIIESTHFFISTTFRLQSLPPVETSLTRAE